MASRRSPFTLTRAMVDDLDEITQLMYDAFSPVTRERLMGCYDPSDIPKLAGKHKHTMVSNPSDIWLKTVDSDTGSIIAAANWKLHMNGDPGNDEVPEWLVGEAKERSKALLGPMSEERARKMKGKAFLHLHLCFTSRDFRRRGAGAMMTKWGCDLADLLFIPIWVESNNKGRMLYEPLGFSVTGNRLVIDGKEQATYMKREGDKAPIVGGKTPSLASS